jgi:acyl-CoA thioesterase
MSNDRAERAMHPFDAATFLEQTSPGHLRGRSSPSYWNWVGPFGGFVAAVAMRSVVVQPNVVGDPLQLTVNFAGPMQEGPFDVNVRPVRTNRTTQHWVVEITQPVDDVEGAASVAIATITTAMRRSVFSHAELLPPPSPQPDQLSRLSPPWNATWIDQYDLRYAEGVALKSTSGNSRSLFWIRDFPNRNIDYPALAAIADASLPRIFVLRPQFTPSATVSLTAYFHGDANTLAQIGNEYLLTESRSSVFDSGFHDQHANIWSRDGRLLVSTQQIVWYKA